MMIRKGLDHNGYCTASRDGRQAITPAKLKAGTRWTDDRA
jgi:hypothetical protein